MSAPAKRPRTPTGTIDLTSSPLVSPAHKRARAPSKTTPYPANSTTSQTPTTSAPQISETQLLHTIFSLPNETKSTILFNLAKTSPSITNQILDAANTSPIATFINELDRVEMCILEGEGGWNPTEEDILSPDEELPTVLADILTKAARGTRYETRRNAIFALGDCVDYMVNPHAELQLEDEEILSWVEKYAEGVHQILRDSNEYERIRTRNEEEWKRLVDTAASADAEELLRILRGFEEFAEVLGSE